MHTERLHSGVIVIEKQDVLAKTCTRRVRTCKLCASPHPHPPTHTHYSLTDFVQTRSCAPVGNFRSTDTTQIRPRVANVPNFACILPLRCRLPRLRRPNRFGARAMMSARDVRGVEQRQPRRVQRSWTLSRGCPTCGLTRMQPRNALH